MNETCKLVAILVAGVVGYSRDRDIFLSYSAKDDAIVRLALEKLEAVGHRCWFAPCDIPTGEFYARLNQ